MSRPLFSCVIPVKGERPFFKDALASLEAQGLGEDLEVIVQDGDVDSRVEVEMGREDSRVEHVETCRDGNEQKELHILYLGRRHPLKGVENLEAAVRQIENSPPLHG